MGGMPVRCFSPVGNRAWNFEDFKKEVLSLGEMSHVSSFPPPSSAALEWREETANEQTHQAQTFAGMVSPAGMRAAEFARLGSEVYVDHAGATLPSERQLRDVFQVALLRALCGCAVSWAPTCSLALARKDQHTAVAKCATARTGNLSYDAPGTRRCVACFAAGAMRRRWNYASQTASCEARGSCLICIGDCHSKSMLSIATHPA